MPRAIEFGLLGPLVVSCGETEVAVRRGHLRALLAVLLAYRLVPVEAITEALWGSAGMPGRIAPGVAAPGGSGGQPLPFRGAGQPASQFWGDGGCLGAADARHRDVRIQDKIVPVYLPVLCRSGGTAQREGTMQRAGIQRQLEPVVRAGGGPALPARQCRFSRT